MPSPMDQAMVVTHAMTIVSSAGRRDAVRVDAAYGHRRRKRGKLYTPVVKRRFFRTD